MHIFLSLFALFLFAVIYMVFNFCAVIFCMRRGLALWRSLATPARRHLHKQLQALTSARIWTTVALHIGGSLTLLFFLCQPLTPIITVSLLLCYVCLVSALTLSLLGQMPYFRSLWNDAAVRIGLLVLPILLGYLARQYAGEWVSELLGTSAVNAGGALFAATAFMLSLVAAILLGAAAVMFELALGVTAWIHSYRKGGGWARWISLSCLAASSFFVTLLAAYAAALLPGSRLGNVTLATIAFEFDATPAGHCVLSDSERPLTRGSVPILKALHLATSQERALLVQRSPALFSPFVLRDLRREEGDTRVVHVVRVADCYVPKPQSADRAASGVLPPVIR